MRHWAASSLLGSSRDGNSRPFSSPITKPIRRASSVRSNALHTSKNAFHDFVVCGRADAVNPKAFGTKAAPHYRLEIPAVNRKRSSFVCSQREKCPNQPLGPEFEEIFAARIREADEFYAIVNKAR
jgi:hypothetical protein